MYAKFRTGADKPLARWQFCYEVTNKFFGHLMDSLYSEEQVIFAGCSETIVIIVSEPLPYLLVINVYFLGRIF